MASVAESEIGETLFINLQGTIDSSDLKLENTQGAISPVLGVLQGSVGAIDRAFGYLLRKARVPLVHLKK